MTRLCTIGYEGATPDAFLAALADANISTLIDVRDAPISRKRGFSKRELAAVLADAGIAYVHLRWLGNPKEGRDAARAGDTAAYHRIYGARLATPAALADLDRAAGIAASGGACLMCFERDPAHCHRGIVAEALAQRLPLSIEHLTAVPSQVE